MAIIKNPEDLNNATNYVATIAFFCCISCVTLMLRFGGGFKASLNIFNSKKNKERNSLDSELYMNGAYRTNRDEFFGNGRLSDPPRKLTPSMVTLPPSEENLRVKSTKITTDIPKANSAKQTRQSTPNVSAVTYPRGDDGDNVPRNSRKNHEKEEKRLEKQRLHEQKEREKAAAKEQAKQEKIREKARKDEIVKTKKDKRKAPAPQPVLPTKNPLAQSSIPQQGLTKQVTQTHAAYSTNTLESSISRSSGPPPYSERVQHDTEQSATTSDVTFGKPIDTSSWDMISEHRQQVSRTTNDDKKHNKQTVMDLKYNFSSAIREERDNSEV